MNWGLDESYYRPFQRRIWRLAVQEKEVCKFLNDYFSKPVYWNHVFPTIATDLVLSTLKPRFDALSDLSKLDIYLCFPYIEHIKTRGYESEIAKLASTIFVGTDEYVARVVRECRLVCLNSNFGSEMVLTKARHLDEICSSKIMEEYLPLSYIVAANKVQNGLKDMLFYLFHHTEEEEEKTTRVVTEAAPPSLSRHSSRSSLSRSLTRSSDETEESSIIEVEPQPIPRRTYTRPKNKRKKYSEIESNSKNQEQQITIERLHEIIEEQKLKKNEIETAELSQSYEFGLGEQFYQQQNGCKVQNSNNKAPQQIRIGVPLEPNFNSKTSNEGFAEMLHLSESGGPHNGSQKAINSQSLRIVVQSQPQFVKTLPDPTPASYFVKNSSNNALQHDQINQNFHRISMSEETPFKSAAQTQLHGADRLRKSKRLRGRFVSARQNSSYQRKLEEPSISFAMHRDDASSTSEKAVYTLHRINLPKNPVKKALVFRREPTVKQVTATTTVPEVTSLSNAYCYDQKNALPINPEIDEIQFSKQMESFCNEIFSPDSNRLNQMIQSKNGELDCYQIDPADLIDHEEIVTTSEDDLYSLLEQTEQREAEQDLAAGTEEKPTEQDQSEFFNQAQDFDAYPDSFRNEMETVSIEEIPDNGELMFEEPKDDDQYFSAEEIEGLLTRRSVMESNTSKISKEELTALEARYPDLFESTSVTRESRDMIAAFLLGRLENPHPSISHYYTVKVNEGFDFEEPQTKNELMFQMNFQEMSWRRIQKTFSYIKDGILEVAEYLDGPSERTEHLHTPNDKSFNFVKF